MKNYSAAHESRAGEVGEGRLGYPPNHVEAANRLAWFLGRLDTAYAREAFYVHLTRDELETARSFVRRYDAGIIKAYRSGVLLGVAPDEDPLRVCLDYCRTVNSNIEAFLRDKPRQARVTLENAKEEFENFWRLVGAQGDLAAALREWDIVHNASEPRPAPGRLAARPGLSRLARKVGRAVKNFRTS